ncbi:hypothetical protein Pint_33583 [Pistacia integerrima]|uniref:Uncharacterized protein n=1 Tax=Pistacia integerrima TaxID=434235 RepID=A0ACC0X2B1_9ROSI|nr:hypothetical protein Pint_33583 [Pistacia integerrima]
MIQLLGFGPNQFEDPFGELTQLRQTGSVIEYQCKFERWLAKAGALTQDRKVTCFIIGLRDSIRTDVQANRPTTLVMAIGLAKLFEARNQAQRRTNIPAVRSANPPRQNIGYQDRSSITTPTIKKMTTDELSERRKKGLYFHCNERYAPGHNCKKLFLIEASWEDKDGDVEMEIEGKEAEQSLEISLHAMAGSESPKTMRIWGGLMGQSVVALIDSGSTHNFISSQIAQRINLHPTSNSRLEVMVASAEKLSSPGKCSNVQLKLQKIPFFVDFFILPLEGYDVVLGTQWLRTLGPIQWDFETLRMTFQKDAQMGTFRGISNLHNMVSEAAPITKITKQQRGVIM